MKTEELNHRFGIEKHIRFIEGKGDLPTAVIDNSFASATISLYGAHVQSYRPHGEQDFLWLSPQSAFEVGKPIRGGIPVCFPWFGPHPTNSQWPVHGFARLQIWTVRSTSITSEGVTELILELQDTTETRAIWPYSFKTELVITVGKHLEVSLIIQNTGKESFTTTNSLHTYFHVKNLETASISGLAKLPYYDPAHEDTTFEQQEEALTISKEENRRYFTHEGECILRDPELKRTIRIQKAGSKVTVIWNPHKETVKNIGDIPNEGYLSFVCIEQTNYYEDATTLVAGAKHRLRVVLGKGE